MASTTTLQVRLSEELRRNSEEVLGAMGLDLPTGVRLFLTKVIQTRSIPFGLEADPAAEILSVDDATQRQMNEIAEVWKKNKKTV